MLGFFIKKAFFDSWDNLLGLIVVNLGFLPILALALLPGIAGFPAFLVAPVLILGGLALSWWFTVASLVSIRWSDFGSFAFRDLPGVLAKAILPGIQMGVMLALLVVVPAIGIPFYIQRGTWGAIASGILFWVDIGLLLCIQYYLPLRFRLGGGFRKNIKKAFLIVMDNPGFSIFLLLYNAILLVVSVFFAFLLPGPSGLALNQHDALRLRMKKYDWLEAEAATPDAAGKSGTRRAKVPWKTLLEEEAELVGKRSLRGMIFPWKD